MPNLASLGPRLIARAFQIVPIKPGAKFPEGIANWQNLRADFAMVRDWSAGAFAGYGVGILTRHVPAVDIDILDAEIADRVEAFAAATVGATMVRYGRRPKRLLVYRTDEPFAKITSARFEDPFGVRHRVEILGDGQQFVAYATHPDTGRPYAWAGDRGPADADAATLPTITAEQARAICDYFESIVPDGWTRVGSATAGRVPRDPWAGFKPRAGKTPDEVRALLDALPEEDPGDYDVWLRVGMALHHEFDGGFEGFELWDAWSQRAPNYGGLESRWNGFRQTPDREPTTLAWVIERGNAHLRAVAAAKAAQKNGELVTLDYLEAKLGRPDWLVEGLIERDAVGVLFGAPGSLKSFVALDLAFCVATGRDWHGRAVKQGPAVYIAGEGFNGLARRAAAWQHKNGRIENRDAVRFTWRPVQFNDPASANAIAESIEAYAEEFESPALVVIDTLAKNFGPGDEDKNADVNAFLHAVETALRQRGHASTVLIVHHSGHGNTKRARGGSALHGGVDFEYRMERAAHGLKATLANTKMKDAPEPEDIHFEAEEVFLGDMDETFSSLVLVECEAPPNRDAVEDKPRLTDGQAALLNLIREEGPLQRQTLHDLARNGGIFDPEKREWFSRTIRRLQELNHIGVDSKGGRGGALDVIGALDAFTGVVE